MKTVIGVVLICAVTVVIGEGIEDSCKAPINLNEEDSTCGEGKGRPKPNFVDPINGVATNDGSWEVAVQVILTVGQTVTVSIGDIEYNVMEFHFHLGRDPTKGSQHTENGQYHQMEMHIGMLPTIGDKAALGFFIDVTDGEDNPAFASLIKAMENLKNIGDTQEMSVNLRDMITPAIDEAFYQYEGTSMKPPCVKTVLLTIYQTPLIISKAQFEAFQAIGVTSSFIPIKTLKNQSLYDSAKPC